MKIGDLVYHIADWAVKKPVVGIILGFDFHYSLPSGTIRVLFTDKTKTEIWPQKELRHVEYDESR